MTKKIKDIQLIISGIFFLLALLISALAFSQIKPNVILIYADDLGYGDLSCYGATKIQTPNIDKLSASGIRFTNCHTTSATCTPSRYGLMTGRYPWRQEGTGVLPGDAALIVPTNKTTLARVFQNAGYKTAVVGKWHLGLGDAVEKNWNKEIKPGPNEVGFDYSFIFPATADRVPTVFLENHFVVGLDPNDTIAVNYKTKIGNDPTGKENPELLKMKANQGHDFTIVNGIGRIGYMSGGKTARWNDEELSFNFLVKATQIIEESKSKPFFLYYALTEPHVPRMPATMFKGKSGLGFRGDAILQIDWTVGEIMKELKYLGLEKNTIVILSSDNGPVLNDGYDDGAEAQLNGHTPAGILRGGKYSIFEAGTRIPFIVSWPGKIKAGLSDAMISQVDFTSSFAYYLNQKIPGGDAEDSENMWNALNGNSPKGRTSLIEHAGTLAIIQNDWKYIEPIKMQKLFKEVNIESGLDTIPQLYNLKNDIGEKINLAEKYPEKVKELQIIVKNAKLKAKN
jgi:arylsulfatase A-like enzyme